MFKHNRSLLGVIGGLGPLATAHFLELVVDMTDARTDQENVDMIIYNFPSIPDRTGYLLGSNLKSPLPGLLSVGHALARDGVSCIAIPCITAHYQWRSGNRPLPEGCRGTLRRHPGKRRHHSRGSVQLRTGVSWNPAGCPLPIPAGGCDQPDL